MSIQIPVQQMMLTADPFETSSSNLTSRPASKVVTSTRVRTPSRWACFSSATPSLMVPSLSMSSGDTCCIPAELGRMCSWARVNPSSDVSSGPSTVLTLAIVSYPFSVHWSLVGPELHRLLEAPGCYLGQLDHRSGHFAGHYTPQPHQLNGPWSHRRPVLSPRWRY